MEVQLNALSLWPFSVSRHAVMGMLRLHVKGPKQVYVPFPACSKFEASQMPEGVQWQQQCLGTITDHDQTFVSLACLMMTVRCCLQDPMTRTHSSPPALPNCCFLRKTPNRQRTSTPVMLDTSYMLDHNIAKCWCL